MSSLYGSGLYGAGLYGVGAGAPASASDVRVFVEAAFGSYPSDATYNWTQIHDTDDANGPNSYVRAFTWQRGIDDIIGRTQTGTGSIVIRNIDGAWQPQNTASPFYPDVIPDLPVRAYATAGGITYDLFQHFMSGFPQRRIGPGYAELTVSTVDGFSGLALATPRPDHAFLTIDPAGANNAITYTAVNPGMGEEDITIRYYGAPHPLQVSVRGKDIEVRCHIAGLGGNPSNTANQIIAAIAASGSASQLVTATNALGSDGTGTIEEDFPKTNLGGADAAVFPQERTGARITRVLDQAGWPAALRDISTGTVDVAEAPFSSNEQGRLLSHLLEVGEEPGEFGIVFVDGGGSVVFLDRNRLYTNSGQATVGGTFSDNHSAGFPIYVDYQPNYDREHVINEWVGTRGGGVAQIVQDTDSIAKHGRTSHSVSSLLTTDTKVQTAMKFGRDEFGQPVQRLQSVTIMPGTNPDTWASCLGMEIGDRIRVLQHLPGVATPVDENYVVTNLQGQMGPGSVAGSRFTFGLWPIRVDNYFVWDDVTYGDVSANKLAYN